MEEYDMKLIIDTDIGTDADDALAITYAIRSGMEIPLITTVHGDTVLRGRIAKKLIALLGPEIPVAAGVSKPIKQTQIFWTGLEGKDFVDDKEKLDLRHDGVDALIETICQNKGDVNIACIGPLTNIATAFQRNPGLPKYINHLYIMGNVILTPDAFYCNYRAHNFKVDPEATDIVLEAAVSKKIITTEVCKKSFLTREELGSYLKTGNAALQYITRAAVAWMDYIKYDVVYLYDPLVVHHHLDPSATTQRKYGKTFVATDVTPGFKMRFQETILQR